jgi:hypothetical protein
MPRIIILNSVVWVIIFCVLKMLSVRYSDCHYATCHLSGCHYAGCFDAAKCHYVELGVVKVGIILRVIPMSVIRLIDFILVVMLSVFIPVVKILSIVKIRAPEYFHT